MSIKRFLMYGRMVRAGSCRMVPSGRMWWYSWVVSDGWSAGRADGSDFIVSLLHQFNYSKINLKVGRFGRVLIICAY